MTSTDSSASYAGSRAETNAGGRSGNHRYVIGPKPPYFPDVFAEITRVQPLTILSVACVAGMTFAAGWRR
jgi:hypothetical protein